MRIDNTENRPLRPGFGLAAALFTVVIWTSWIVSTRFVVHSDSQSLSPEILAFLRFSVATLLLAPHWWRIRLLPRDSSPWALAGLMGAGVPYLFAVLWGLTYAPATDVGPLLPGTLPLFVAGLSALCLGERFSGLRKTGFALIIGGVLVITWHGFFATGVWRGHLLILLGAFSWAIYTIAFRKSGLTATEAAAFIALWSLVGLLMIYGPEIWQQLQQMSRRQLIEQVLLQGILAGIVAPITYATAVVHLGASRTAAITAITPASAMGIAALTLGESLTLQGLLGCALIVCGVLLASGVLRRSDAQATAEEADGNPEAAQ